MALDYPRLVSLGRLLRRTAARCVDRRLIGNGNTESLRNAFSRRSIVYWHFQSFSRQRARIRRRAASPAGPRVLHLTSPRQTEAWLAALGDVRLQSR